MENLTERVFVRLPQSLVESLKQSAAALDVSISEIFRDSLVEWRHYLHCDPPKPETRKPVEFMVTPQQLQLFEAMAKKHGKFEQHHSGTKTRMVYKLLKGWLK